MTYYKYDFYKYVTPHVYGVPGPVVEDVVEDVIMDFCQQTGVYRQWLDDHIFVSVDDEEVELDLPDNTAVVDVLAVQEVEEDGLYGGYLEPDTYLFSNQSGTPTLLFNTPSEEDYEARVRVALRPTVGFTIVPEWLYIEWRDVISEGVLAHLLAMRAKPWYALTESEQHRQKYLDGIRTASGKTVLETLNKVTKPVSRYI